MVGGGWREAGGHLTVPVADSGVNDMITLVITDVALVSLNYNKWRLCKVPEDSTLV